MTASRVNASVRFGSPESKVQSVRSALTRSPRATSFRAVVSEDADVNRGFCDHPRWEPRPIPNRTRRYRSRLVLLCCIAPSLAILERLVGLHLPFSVFGP